MFTMMLSKTIYIQFDQPVIVCLINETNETNVKYVKYPKLLTIP